jgi:hypothetical protein
MSQRPEARQNTVNVVLTKDRLDRAGPDRRPKSARRRHRGEVEDDDFARFAVQINQVHGRRLPRAT